MATREQALDQYDEIKDVADRLDDGRWTICWQDDTNFDFKQIEGDGQKFVIDQLRGIQRRLRSALTVEDAAAKAPEDLAESLLRLELDAQQREGVLDAIRAFVEYERSSIAAVVDKMRSEWDGSMGGDEEPFVKALDGLRDAIRARGRLI